MIEKFGDYMYYLLSAPFKHIRKEKNQWYLFFRVIGQLFDVAKLAYRTVRKESMVKTASPLMLPEHGFDRTLTRYEGESWENFRIRLMAYADTCLLGGTEVGTLLAVQSLGFIDVRMVSCYKLDGNRERWAEFYVIIENDVDTPPQIALDIIRREVRKVKKVSAKDNYQYRYGIECRHDEVFILGSIIYCFEAMWLNGHTLNGAWKLDGRILLNSIHDNNPICLCHIHEAVNEEHVEGYIETKYHWWRLNGEFKLDGSRKLDAKITKEAI